MNDKLGQKLKEIFDALGNLFPQRQQGQLVPIPVRSNNNRRGPPQKNG